MNPSAKGIFTLGAFFTLQFFSTAALSWRMDVNFNDGVPGQKAEDTPHSFSGTANGSFFDTSRSYEGGMSAKLTIKRCDQGFGKWGGSLKHPKLGKGDEVWLRVRTYMPNSFDPSVSNSYCSNLNDGGGGKLKFLRVHTATPSNTNLGYNDIYLSRDRKMNFIYEGKHTSGWVSSMGPGLAKDKWETVEMYLKLSDVPVSSGGQALIRIWQNGILINEITNKNTLKSANSVADFAYIFTYWNGGSPKDQHMWIDDIVYTSDRPSGRDSKGNPFVGMGDSSQVASQPKPKPPGKVSISEPAAQ